jgi:NAD(P)-dependent dehydrogenase (short-subunit alcohol dehydrogenase family)
MKKVVITGASSGIGRSAALKFCASGYSVVALGRSEIKLARLKEEALGCSGKLSTEACDLLDFKAVSSILEKHHDLEILINNAGIYQRTDWLNPVLGEYEALFDTNVKAAYLISQCAIKTWKAQDSHGLILHNASTLGNKQAPFAGLYSASKAALLSLSKSIAMEFAPNIRSIAILPGVIDTPIHQTMGEEKALEFRKTMAGFHPLGRIGSPEDISSLMLWLCSEESQWITGSEFVVDGGISLVC